MNIGNRRRRRSSDFNFYQTNGKTGRRIWRALPDVGPARRFDGAVGCRRRRLFAGGVFGQENPPSDIVYKRVTPRFFVVSSFRKGKIWYDRCNFAGRFINCVLINYPAAEKSQWDGIVTRISNTLASR
jgi:hypothetical protein